jgi:putative CRISPR-associated protein (TIGR02619 family)
MDMAKILIATCGISILNNSKDVKDKFAPSKRWNELNDEEVFSIEEEITKRLDQLEANNRLCGAEVNSTQKLISKGKFSGEKIYLIVSDTLDGKMAGRLVKSILTKKVNIKSIEVKVVENLNTDREFDFAKKGLRNLVSVMGSIINKEGENNLAISPIGGLKAQIFMVGLIAQIFKIKAYYMYEGFDEIIELLPLPISLDWDFFNRNLEVISKIKRDGEVEKRDIESFFQAEGLLRNITESVHVDGKDYISLSPLGEMAYMKFFYEAINNLPIDTKLKRDKKHYHYKGDEAHADMVRNRGDFERFRSMILDKSYVEKLIINYYTPDNKGDIIRFTKSSNNEEGRVIGFEFNRKQGMLKGNIFVTEAQDEKKVEAAIADLYETKW